MKNSAGEAQKLWNATPCGTGDHLAGLDFESLEFFDAIRANRYQDQAWMDGWVNWESAGGKRVLEIGHGVGTDLLRFSEHGAAVHGIDITEEHHRLAKRNFELHGQQCELKLCDATAIDYPSDYFDVVYSFGVLHHIADIPTAIAEAHRVLKPGGTLLLALYNRYSAFHLCLKVFLHGILLGRLWRLGYDGLMATVETGADGINVKPLVRTYSRRQLRQLLNDFSDVTIDSAHFRRTHVGINKISRLIPESLEAPLSHAVGWYLIVTAEK